MTKFHIHTKILILKVKLDFFRLTASKLEIFMIDDMLRMYFFILAARRDIRVFTVNSVGLQWKALFRATTSKKATHHVSYATQFICPEEARATPGKAWQF